MPDQGKLELHLTCSSLGHVTVTSATVTEGLSEVTRARVRFVADASVDDHGPIGTSAELAVLVDGVPKRTWKLLVTAVELEHVRSGRHAYVVDLADPLERLGHRSDVRIFQKMSAKDIVADVLQRSGATDSPSWTLKRTPPVRVYCVQYRETDFDFASRLLEHEGIFYVCNAGDAGDQLTFADDPASFTAVEGDPLVPFVQGTHGNGVRDLEVEYAWTTDRYSTLDWNFQTPKVDLSATTTVGKDSAGAIYEFPGCYSTQADGQALSDIRGQEIASRQMNGRGESDRIDFRPGRTFTLTRSFGGTYDIEWLLRTVQHVFVLQRHEGTDNESDYVNRFTCSPKGQPYRPQRKTARPLALGSDCVVVTGPSGEEIHTEALGRMTGKFYWDRVGKNDETSSCWLRVAQLPIGGSMALARVGWEMVVRYLYGDPDRPIAIARADNAVHTSPYAYPAAVTSLALKTLSSPGGAKHNEFSMQDSGGGMQIAMNAAKDYMEDVQNDKTQKIGVNESLDVGIDHASTVGGNQKVSIGAMLTKSVSSDEQVVIGGDRTRTVGAAEMVTVTGACSEKVTGSDSESVGAARITMATMGVTRSAKGSHSLTVGGAMVSASALGVQCAVAGVKSETVGAVKLSLSGGPVGESIIGAHVLTVGGAIIASAAGKYAGTSKTSTTIEVGGVAMINAGGQAQFSSKTIKITVGGVANILGGGGIANFTPGTATFLGLVTLKGSDGVSLSGAPNLAG